METLPACASPTPRHALPASIVTALVALTAAAVLLAAPAAAQAPVTPAAAQPPVTPAAVQSIEPPAPAAGPGDALSQQVQRLALDGTRRLLDGAASPRVEVSVGALDPRLRLAPCERIEPHLPDGTRLWGKSRIGVRCVQGAVKWNVYLPVTVKVFGSALVARQPLAAGTVVSAADLATVEVDLAEDASAPVLQAELAAGRTLLRPLQAGQSLRLAHLKPRVWFAAGDMVTVVAQGEGFSIAGQALSLSPGTEGLPVRLRTESGRVLNGLAIGERRASLAL